MPVADPNIDGRINDVLFTPQNTQRLYLPSGTDLGAALGLNIASPLDQGDKRACKAALVLLRHSPDPIVREYYEARILGSEEFR